MRQHFSFNLGYEIEQISYEQSLNEFEAYMKRDKRNESNIYLSEHPIRTSARIKKRTLPSKQFYQHLKMKNEQQRKENKFRPSRLLNKLNVLTTDPRFIKAGIYLNMTLMAGTFVSGFNEFYTQWLGYPAVVSMQLYADSNLLSTRKYESKQNEQM